MGDDEGLMNDRTRGAVYALYMAIIRKATIADAKGIHDAHMRSIQEVCSQDHSPEEIEAWGGRPYREEQRQSAINNHSVWVVETNGIIKGYGLLAVTERNGERVGYVGALYLTPEVKGGGYGKEIFRMMVETAKAQGLKKLTLESTITAHEFYKKMGFKDTGDQILTDIAGVGIRSYPMELPL